MREGEGGDGGMREGEGGDGGMREGEGGGREMGKLFTYSSWPH